MIAKVTIDGAAEDSSKIRGQVVVPEERYGSVVGSVPIGRHLLLHPESLMAQPIAPGHPPVRVTQVVVSEAVLDGSLSRPNRKLLSTAFSINIPNLTLRDSQSTQVIMVNGDMTVGKKLSEKPIVSFTQVTAVEVVSINRAARLDGVAVLQHPVNLVDQSLTLM